jgi:subtilisin family serine protease
LTLALALVAVSAAVWVLANGGADRPKPISSQHEATGNVTSQYAAVPSSAQVEPGQPQFAKEPVPEKRGTPPSLPPLRAVSVKFLPGLSRAEREAALNGGGFKLLRDIPQIGWASAEPLDPETDVDDLLGKLAADPRVALAERQAWARADMAPNDPYYVNQWAFLNTGALAGSVAGCDAKIAPAWDWGRGDGVVIAVVDTGVDFSQPDLVGKMHPASWDYVHNDATVFHPADGDRHGTHVAGTAAAITNNAVGGAGTAFNAQIMSLKFLAGPWDNGLVADGAAAIVRAADNGADVINCSWGTPDYVQVLADAVTYAASKGVLVVAAAGNDGVDIDTSARYPASLPATNLVTVAATTFSDSKPAWSNYGAASVDLGAPGEAIISVLPISEGGLFVDASPYKIAYLSFPFESIFGASNRATVMSRCMSNLGASTASPILIIDDSWPFYASEAAGARLARYTTALTTLGYTNVTTWSTQASGVPTTAQLTGKTVIWFSGAATLRYASPATVFSQAERDALTPFLDGGGRMMVSSADAGHDCNWIGGTYKTFYESYFHSIYLGDESMSPDLIGRTGGILSGLNLSIYDKSSFDCVISKDASAALLGHWPGYGEDSGTSMAAPHVTGTVALMYSRTPTLTADIAKQRLLAEADPIAALSGKCVTGARLDAAGAVGKLGAPAPLQVGPAGPGAQVLYWHNPHDADFAAVRLLSRPDTYPAGPNDASATVLYEGPSETATATGLVPGTTVHYAAYARNAWSSWSEPARVMTTVVDPPSNGVPIPLGSDVSVTCLGVTATFAQVTTPGWLSITRIDPVFAPPANFAWQLGGYYEIHPVGEVPLPCLLSIPYDAGAAPPDLGTLRFFHRTAGGWDDITTGVDPVRHVVTASASSFSDFGLGGPSNPSGPVPLPLEEPWQGALLAIVAAGAIAMSQRMAKRGAA